MEGGEKFHQRWEFRRKEIDRDSSSDDNRSNASGSPAVKRHNLVTDVVVLDSDEANDHPESQRRDDNNTKTLQPNEKKTKSSKKKQVSNGSRVKKENKRKRNTETEEIMMLKGLKTFADSLIQELVVSRENMCAQMRDEMRELVACGMPKKEPINKKKTVHRRKGVVKPKNAKSNLGAPDACKRPKASDEAVKNDHRALEVTKKTETRVPETAQINSELVVSSSHLTLPTVSSNTQFQNPINHHLPSNDNTHVMNNSNLERHIGRLIDSTKFGSFYHKSASMFGQSCPQPPSVPLMAPLSQGMGNGSSISGLTSFISRDNVVPSMNGLVRAPRENVARTDQMFAYSNMACKDDGEFEPVRPQEVKDGHVCSTNMRNQR